MSRPRQRRTLAVGASLPGAAAGGIPSPARPSGRSRSARTATKSSRGSASASRAAATFASGHGPTARSRASATNGLRMSGPVGSVAERAAASRTAPRQSPTTRARIATSSARSSGRCRQTRSASSNGSISTSLTSRVAASTPRRCERSSSSCCWSAPAGSRCSRTSRHQLRAPLGRALVWASLEARRSGLDWARLLSAGSHRHRCGRAPCRPAATRRARANETTTDLETQ
jgi:hypothetical protein